MIDQNYITRIRSILGHVVGVTDLSAITSTRAVGSAYEAYVLARLVNVIVAPAAWRIIGADGVPTTRFVYRGGPGGVEPLSASPDPHKKPGSVEFTYQGATFEIFNSVRWRGRSGEEHEIDLAVAPKVDADTIRTTGVATGNILWGVECKYLSNDKSLGPKIARELIGYVKEFCPARMHLVTVCDFESVIEDIFAYYEVDWGFLCHKGQSITPVPRPVRFLNYSYGIDAGQFLDTRSMDALKRVLEIYGAAGSTCPPTPSAPLILKPTCP